jgi:hypothetical protein
VGPFCRTGPVRLGKPDLLQSGPLVNSSFITQIPLGCHEEVCNPNARKMEIIS